MTTGSSKRYPLSPMQAGMLFYSTVAPGEGLYIQQMICRFSEYIDIGLLRQAWIETARRHPVLRAEFSFGESSEPFQIFGDGKPLLFGGLGPLDYYSPEEKEQHLERHLASDRERGFDLTEGTPCRFALFNFGPEDCVLVWSFHHALLDGRSHFLVLREFLSLYDALVAGEDFEPPEPRPYGEYIDWLGEQDFSRSRLFWQEMLAGFESASQVSVYPSPTDVSSLKYDHGLVSFRLDSGISDAVESFAGQCGVTYNTVLQAAWSIMLAAYSGRNDIVFGATRACRRSALEGADEMVGLFINTVPVRAVLSKDMSVRTLLGDLRQKWVEFRDHEHTPLLDIQSWSDISFGNQLFDNLFVFESFHFDSALRASGGKWSGRSFELREKDNFPLSVAAYLEDGLRIKIEFDRNLYSGESIERMAGHLRQVILGIIQDPDRPLSSIEMLTEDERQMVMFEWNGSAGDYPDDRSLHRLFEEQAGRTPGVAAIESGETALSYGELNAYANRLAAHLAGLGVQRGQTVGVCMERDVDIAAAALGIMKAGCSYLPLDPSYPSARLKFMIDDSAVPVILAHRSTSVAWGEGDAKIVEVDTDSDAIAALDPGDRGIEISPGEIAYLIYTSGSTGTPKGVRCRHAGAVNLFFDLQRRRTIEPGDRCSFWTSFSFDVSVYELFAPLVAGGTVCVVPEEVRFNGAEFPGWLHEQRIASAYLPPFMIADLHDWVKENPGASGLKRLLVGVEPISEELLAGITVSIPGLLIVNGYGPTEAAICSTLYDVEPDPVPERNTPIGMPVWNTKVYLLDRLGRPVPAGVPGEIAIGGRGLAEGYLDRPGLTEEKFIEDHLSGEKGGRLYMTGDRAYHLSDGNIMFMGRADDQVKVRGFRVEPGEIENVIGRYPGVRDNVVVAFGEAGAKRLVAYIVPEAESGFAVAALKDSMSRELPSYMVPSVFMLMEALPQTQNGKVDRRALPAPDLDRGQMEHEYIAPGSDVEVRLVGIWEGILGIKHIGIHDDFFDLGGHSLLAVQLVTEIKKRFGKNLPLASIFEAPTVKKYASLLADDAVTVTGSTIVPIQPEGTRKPVFLVHAHGGGVFFYRGLAACLGNDQPLYGIQAVGLDGSSRALETIEKMAERYIEDLKAFQPSGPYYLGGRCLGAYISLEMAVRLRGMGDDVAFLGILDSYWQPREMLPAAARDKEYHLTNIRRLRGWMKVAYILTRVGLKLERIRDRFAESLCSSILGRGGTLPGPLRKWYINSYIPAVNRDAEKKYSPPVFDGRMTFFQASSEEERDPREFWGTLTGEELEVLTVEASHRDILVEPNVSMMADALKAALERIESGSGEGEER